VLPAEGHEPVDVLGGALKQRDSFCAFQPRRDFQLQFIFGLRRHTAAPQRCALAEQISGAGATRLRKRSKLPLLRPWRRKSPVIHNSALTRKNLKGGGVKGRVIHQVWSNLHTQW
jgi:hypothetical protein